MQINVLSLENEMDNALQSFPLRNVVQCFGMQHDNYQLSNWLKKTFESFPEKI